MLAGLILFHAIISPLYSGEMTLQRQRGFIKKVFIQFKFLIFDSQTLNFIFSEKNYLRNYCRLHFCHS